MAIEFKLPELGENIESAEVVKVLVSAGDKVVKNQSVVEIETDKATVEVPVEIDATVDEVRVEDGSTVNVGETILVLEASERSESAQVESLPTEPEKKESEEPEVEKEVVAAESSASTSEIKLPELGENIETAEVTKVLLKVGDSVSANQSVVEIETDKATVEVPSEIEGTVKEVKISDGDTAKVGQVLFVLEATGSVPEAEKEVKSEPTPETTAEKKPDVPKPAASKTASAPMPLQRSISGKIAPAAPSVRRFAREIGIDIHQVPGSGPGGRISVDDVKVHSKSLNQKYSAAASSGAPIGISAEPLPDFSKWGSISKEPMSNIRKKTATHLSYAWSTIPHVTQVDKADITDLEKLRKHYAKQVEAAGGKLTVTAILLKVLASALKKFPQFNSSIDMDKKEIIFKRYYNIGVAVDTDRGLLVPVIKDVDKKSITDIAVELSEISVKAREKKLSIEDMQGGNFSLSNLGGIGGTSFTPIVNSPEVAILGVSRGAYEPVYKDGEFVPRLILPLSLSYDHRIIDGADGARFVRWVAQALENPILLSL